MLNSQMKRAAIISSIPAIKVTINIPFIPYVPIMEISMAAIAPVARISESILRQKPK
jgi:hypothetical protein